MSWRWLLAAPHRLCFFAAALMLSAATLAGLAAWRAWPWVGAARGTWAVAPSVAHGLVMVFGFMPMFIAGFQFTAGPRWLQQPEVQARGLAMPVALSLAGWAVFAAGVRWSTDAAAFGLMLAGLALLVFAVRFLHLLRASQAADLTHALLIGASSACTAAMLAFAMLGVASGDRALIDGALRAALWSGLGLAYAAAMHRLVPIFDAGVLPRLNAWGPAWLMWALAATLCAEGVAAMGDALGGWSAWLYAAAAAWSASAAAGVFALAWRWSRMQSLRPRLIRMLHAGLVWLGIALAQHAIAQTLSASGRGGGALELGALHALAMGFMGSLMLAMVTRVSCAHGGRAVAADDALWRAFCLLQVAALARLAAALGAAVQGPLWGDSIALLLRVALLAWAAAMLPWAARCARWYLSPGLSAGQARGMRGR
jgi:uncharacterized protein involved in response to NO